MRLKTVLPLSTSTVCHIYNIDGTHRRFRGKCEKCRKRRNFRHFGKPLWAIRHFPKANFPTFAPCFRLVGSFPRKAFSPDCGSNLYPPPPCLHCVSYLQHRRGTQKDFWEMRRVPKVPEFSPLRGKSLGVLRHLPNDNFPTFRTMFPLSGGGFLFSEIHLVQFVAANCTFSFYF